MTERTLAGIEADLARYLVEAARARGVTLEGLERDDDLLARGVFDSLSLLDFVMHVERTIDRRIPSEDVVPENFGSLGAITAYLSRTFELS